MKLVRYGPAGKEKPGLIDADGKLRDLSRKVKEIDGTTLAPAELAKLRKLDTKKLPPGKGQAAPRAPAWRRRRSSWPSASTTSITPRKRARPFRSSRSSSSRPRPGIVGANDNIMLPPDSTHTDWDVELGIVIGRTARYVSVKDALKYVAGYCVVNDVSEREYQMKRSASQWNKGKGCDTFGPMGPYMVTSDEIKDPQNLDMWLDVNGERRQTGNTRTMIFGCAELVADGLEHT